MDVDKKYPNLTPDDVINACESALEDDNRHEECAAIRGLWEGIEPFVKEGKELEAAKALADGLQCGWEHCLQYVMSREDEE